MAHAYGMEWNGPYIGTHARMGLSQTWELVFPTLFSKGPSQALDGSSRTSDGPSGTKIGPYRSNIEHPEHLNGSFSFNADRERLQYSIVRIKNVPPGSEKG